MNATTAVQGSAATAAPAAASRLDLLQAELRRLEADKAQQVQRLQDETMSMPIRSNGLLHAQRNVKTVQAEVEAINDDDDGDPDEAPVQKQAANQKLELAEGAMRSRNMEVGFGTQNMARLFTGLEGIDSRIAQVQRQIVEAQLPPAPAPAPAPPAKP